MEEPERLSWTDADWLQTTHCWIEDQLDREELKPNGEVEQFHIRPWSTVMRVPTHDGTLYFKANGPAFQHEAGILSLLSQSEADRVPELLAVDKERGWMLTRDGGVPLRPIFQKDRDLRHLQRAFVQYAGLQQRMAKRSEEMLTAGLPDHRLTRLPELYLNLLEDEETLQLNPEEAIIGEKRKRLHQFAPRFAEICEELAAFGLPETLQHDDLHDNNILYREGQYRIFDWGDSNLSHPFLTMTVALRAAARTLEWQTDNPALNALIHSYLICWKEYGSREALLRAYALAQPVAKVCRALTWYRFVATLQGDLRKEYAIYPAGWLGMLLEAEP